VPVSGTATQLPGGSWKSRPLASRVAPNERTRSWLFLKALGVTTSILLAQTICLPYRGLAACVARQGNVRRHKKPPREWLESMLRGVHPDTALERGPSSARSGQEAKVA
jgi:hypothetical protein